MISNDFGEISRNHAVMIARPTTSQGRKHGEHLPAAINNRKNHKLSPITSNEIHKQLLNGHKLCRLRSPAACRIHNGRDLLAKRWILDY